MYWLLRLLNAILGRMSLEALRKTGSAIGAIAWYILPNRRRVAKVNARIIGAENPDKVAKESFKHSFMSYLDIIYIKKVDNVFINKYVIVDNAHYYNELIEANQHFATMTGHMGSWDLLTPTAVKALGIKVIIAWRGTSSEGTNRFINYVRRFEGIEYIQQYGFMKKINEYEKMGYRPSTMLDHVGTTKNSIYVPFFGKEVETIPGIVAVCVTKNIPILPMYLLRTEKGFRLRLNKPIWPDNCIEDEIERGEEMLARVNKEYESIIKEYPEQWYLLHRRFKRIRTEDGEIVRDIYEKH